MTRRLPRSRNPEVYGAKHDQNYSHPGVAGGSVYVFMVKVQLCYLVSESESPKCLLTGQEKGSNLVTFWTGSFQQ